MTQNLLEKPLRFPKTHVYKPLAPKIKEKSRFGVFCFLGPKKFWLLSYWGF
jgi:hypothetical protein